MASRFGVKLRHVLDQAKSRLTPKLKKAKAEITRSTESWKKLRFPKRSSSAQDSQFPTRPYPHLPSEIWLEILSRLDTITLWSICRLVSRTFHALAERTVELHSLHRLHILACGGHVAESNWPAHWLVFVFKEFVPEDSSRAVYTIHPGEHRAWESILKRGISIDAFIDHIANGQARFAIASMEGWEQVNSHVRWVVRIEPNWMYVRSVPGDIAVLHEETESDGMFKSCTLTVDWRKMINEYTWKKKLQDEEDEKEKEELRGPKGNYGMAFLDPKVYARFMPKTGTREEWTEAAERFTERYGMYRRAMRDAGQVWP